VWALISEKVILTASKLDGASVTLICSTPLFSEVIGVSSQLDEKRKIANKRTKYNEVGRSMIVSFTFLYDVFIIFFEGQKLGQ
jgi:hypothetical protein